MNKRFAALCCACMCLLTAAAHAETPTLTLAAVRAQTEVGWHETYEAHHRTIAVELSITTPDVSAMPVLRVAFAPKLSDDVADSLKAGMETLLWNTQWTHKEANGGFNGTFQNEANELWYSPVSESLSAQLNASGSTDFTMMTIPLAELDFDKAYAENSALTLRQADAFYRDWMARLYPEQKLDVRISNVQIQSPITSKRKTIVEQGAYWLDYRQVMNGIPVLARANEAFRASNGRLPALEDILEKGGVGDSFVLSENDFSVRYSLYVPQDVLYDDVPLCSFDAIRAKLEQSIADGNIREVRSAELGYVAFPEPDSPQTLLLLPMWAVRVRWLDKATQEIDPHWLKYPEEYAEIHVETLFFNAQTGEMLDHLRMDAKRCVPPAIVGW